MFAQDSRLSSHAASLLSDPRFFTATPTAPARPASPPSPPLPWTHCRVRPSGSPSPCPRSPSRARPHCRGRSRRCCPSRDQQRVRRLARGKEGMGANAGPYLHTRKREWRLRPGAQLPMDSQAAIPHPIASVSPHAYSPGPPPSPPFPRNGKGDHLRVVPARLLRTAPGGGAVSVELVLVPHRSQGHFDLAGRGRQVSG